jgi:NAD(P)-dependent dehydrogenase (short-subunit alcohol dehydrogenase family)
MSKHSYQGKHVVVSGCFSGMGEAVARSLVEQGAEVHGIDYKDVSARLASFNKVDLRNPAEIDAAADKIRGPVDALFNCAGLPQTFSPLEVMKVNYLGTRRLTENLIPFMREGSAIATISSTAGLGWSQHMALLFELIAQPDYDASLRWMTEHPGDIAQAYSLSKEAIIVWTMLSGASLIKKGIRINCTLPGPTQTPMMGAFESTTPKAILDAAAQPIGRRALPEEQAAPLIFLNGEGASYINGVALPVDGGFVGATATGQIDMAAIIAQATSR